MATHQQPDQASPREVAGHKETTPRSSFAFEDTASLLRYVYADLTRISQIARPDIVLHTADRSLCCPAKEPIRGVEAAQTYEEHLAAATGGTMVMNIQNISANEHFGTVLGTLQAGSTGRTISMPFCGVWRFVDGRAVEHWENAFEPARFRDWLLSGRG